LATPREYGLAPEFEPAFLRLLQLSAVTNSFGAVRALQGVSFDLWAGAPGQPGGLPEISRGLSAATPPERHPKTRRTPEGCQNRSVYPSSNHRRESLGPLRGAGHFCPLTGGVALLRAAQPPASFCEPSGFIPVHKAKTIKHL
jgi:hypothetical protein